MIKEKAPNGCPLCGSKREWIFIGEKKEGLSAGKAIVGGVLFGGIGALAGAASGNSGFSYHCRKCGFSETYKIRNDFVYNNPVEIEQKDPDSENAVNNQNVVIKNTPVILVNGDNIKAILARIDLLLEDKEWEKAYDYCEQVLNYDPYNAEVYIKRILVSLKLSKESDLKIQKNVLEQNPDYKKAIRFSDDETRIRLQEYNDIIKKNIEDENNESLYKEALFLLAKSDIDDHKKAEEIFIGLGNYKDSPECLERCKKNRLLLEEEQKEKLYEKANDLLNKENLSEYKSAEEIFRGLGDYKESVEYLEECRRKIDDIERNEEVLRRKKKKRILIFLIAISSFVIMGICFGIKYNIENEQRLQRDIAYKDATIKAVKEQAYQWAHEEVIDSAKDYALTVSNFNVDFEKENDKGEEFCLKGKFSYEVRGSDWNDTRSLIGTITVTGEWYDENYIGDREVEMHLTYDKE